MYKKIALILFSFLWIPSVSFGIQCMGEPKEYEFKELGRKKIVLPANGILRIKHSSQVDLSEVFQGRGFPFIEFQVGKNIIKDEDNRNPIIKWFKPREIKADFFTFDFSLNENKIRSLLGSKTDLDIVLRLYSKNDIKTIEIKFTEHLSFNCQPY